MERIKLTYQQDLFCREYIIDGNAYQSAIRAGYAKATAQAKSSLWVKQDRYQARINDLRRGTLEKLEVSAERVISEIAKLGFSNISDYVTILPGGSVEFKSFDGISIDHLASIKSVKLTKKGVTHFELYSKADALETLCKYLGLFRELAPNAEREASRKELTEAERAILREFAISRTQTASKDSKPLQPRLVSPETNQHLKRSNEA